MRVALISRLPLIVRTLDETIRAQGHETVGVVTTEGPPGRYGLDDLPGLVAGSPRHLDMLIGSGAHRFAALLGALDADVAVCAGFPVRIPVDALAVPRLGIINAHPALLPRHRGPNPIAWALRNGDAELGYSVHRMDEDFDTGPLLAQGSTPMEDAESPEEFFERLLGLLSTLVPQALERVEAGETGTPQSEDEASYAGFFDPSFAELDLSRPALEVHRQVRAWWATAVKEGPRGPLTDLDGERVRVLRSWLDDTRGGRRVECGDGPIWLLDWAHVDS